MAEPEFTIGFDKQRHILRARLMGPWLPETVERFAAEMQEAKARHAKTLDSGSAISVLIDAREHGVQSQQVVSRLRELAGEFSRDVGRTAVIVTSAVHQLQAKRINPVAEHRVFATEGDAIAWLCGDQPPTV
jgi:hypothetical protein